MTVLAGRSVMITGGTGSFGRRFVEKVLASDRPRRLVVFSRDELKQYEMQQVLDAPELRFFLGDVRDKERLHRAMDGIEIVVHAAAMKQVPASEYNPMEAIKTNILGAENIANVCIDHGVKKVLALSTDKAANPVNLYGATKLCSDKLLIAANSLSGRRDTRFSVVRYGNVIGSRGSVVPFFESQRPTGVLTITDPRMTRFWITLDRGVQFVLDSIERMVGGELFVPKIPSMSIMDLASALAPECRTETIGIRPGEKLHEVMITLDEGPYTLEYDSYYVVQPAVQWWDREKYVLERGGCPVPEGFQYCSDRNEWWLSKEELREVRDS